jgi:hypothetical protein
MTEESRELVPGTLEMLVATLVVATTKHRLR